MAWLRYELKKHMHFVVLLTGILAIILCGVLFSLMIGVDNGSPSFIQQANSRFSEWDTKSSDIEMKQYAAGKDLHSGILGSREYLELWQTQVEEQLAAIDLCVEAGITDWNAFYMEIYYPLVRWAEVAQDGYLHLIESTPYEGILSLQDTRTIFAACMKEGIETYFIHGRYDGVDDTQNPFLLLLWFEEFVQYRYSAYCTVMQDCDGIGAVTIKQFVSIMPGYAVRQVQGLFFIGMVLFVLLFYIFTYAVRLQEASPLCTVAYSTKLGRVRILRGKIRIIIVIAIGLWAMIAASITIYTVRHYKIYFDQYVYSYYNTWMRPMLPNMTLLEFLIFWLVVSGCFALLCTGISLATGLWGMPEKLRLPLHLVIGLLGTSVFYRIEAIPTIDGKDLYYYLSAFPLRTLVAYGLLIAALLLFLVIWRYHRLTRGDVILKESREHENAV